MIMFKHYLFPKSRLKYVKKDHTREAKDKGCLFCRIAKDDPEVDKMILYKDDMVMAVMNIYPYNVGHLEVIPVRHVVWLEELTKEEYKALYDMVDKCVKLLRKVETPVAMNIGLNMGGDCAGGSILHLHVHIVPRYQRDFGFMELTDSTRVLVEPVEETYRKLMEHAGMLK